MGIIGCDKLPLRVDHDLINQLSNHILPFQANLVPNGGFESLPDSLITKQLASLLHSRDWETAAATQEQDGAKAGTQRTGGDSLFFQIPKLFFNPAQ